MASTEIVLHPKHQRPDPNSYAALFDAATATVSDALGRLVGVGGAMRAQTAARRFCGPAFTVRCRPHDNLAALVALEHVQAGDVVVIDAGGHLEGAVIGGNYAALAKARGAVALVANGAARDLDELEALNLPVFALGLTPNGPFKDGPGEIRGQVSLQGGTVNSGNIVLGDADGLVVVPQARIATAIDGVRTIQAREREMARSIVGGDFPDWLSRLIGQAKIEDRS